MILINKTYENWDQESLVLGDTDDKGFEFEDVEYSFRELVDLMKEHQECSSYPATGSIREWLSNTIDPDFITSFELEITSIHYSRNNNVRSAKYWKLAMKAAGIIK